MPLINDGTNATLVSNSEGPSAKGKIYFGEAHHSYYNELADSLHLEGDTDQTGNVNTVGDLAVTGDVAVIGNTDQTGNVDQTGDLTVVGDVEGTTVTVGTSALNSTGLALGSGKIVKVNNLQVVGARGAHIADPSGTSDALDVEARATIVSILAALEAHGLVATS